MPAALPDAAPEPPLVPLVALPEALPPRAPILAHPARVRLRDLAAILGGVNRRTRISKIVESTITTMAATTYRSGAAEFSWGVVDGEPDAEVSDDTGDGVTERGVSTPV